MRPTEIDATHDPKLTSFVLSAQEPESDFPLQNLPLGVFRRGAEGPPRLGCAIGRLVLDLVACAERGLFLGLPSQVLGATQATSLNALMACPAHERRALRHRLSHLLRAEGGQVTARPQAQEVLVPQADAQMLLPAVVGDHTDF
ncbi:MAG TPA: fumarylacetoacetase, partial [Vicinamibacteria bacterium]